MLIYMLDEVRQWGVSFIKDTNLEYYAKDSTIEQTFEAADSSEKQLPFKFIRSYNFYMLFWLFIVGSIFGCYLEQIQYYFIKGIWECRAGVIWGPFSEIYGCGIVLMYLLLGKLKQKHPMIIFFTAMFCGATFEYIAAFFQEVVFHSETWNYSNKALNIGGKTSLEYSIYWGLLGLAFARWVFPKLCDTISKMRGNFFFVITWIFIIFMTVNISISAIAVNRWNERIQGEKTSSFIEQFLDKNYDNTKMDELYPHLKFVQK